MYITSNEPDVGKPTVESTSTIVWPTLTLPCVCPLTSPITLVLAWGVNLPYKASLEPSKFCVYEPSILIL